MAHPFSLRQWLTLGEAAQALAAQPDDEKERLAWIELLQELGRTVQVKQTHNTTPSNTGDYPGTMFLVERQSLLDYCRAHNIPPRNLDPDSHQERHHQRMPGTRLQDIQEEMERQFYLTYEKGVTKPPRREDVVKWLMDQDVTEHVARVMFTIAYPDPKSERG